MKSLGKGARWLCHCDCGVEKIINAKDFKTVRSCGCLIREIKRGLTGQRFGRLVVIEQKGNVHGSSLWLVRCDCGKEKLLRGGNLINGGTTSCGCLKAEHDSLYGKKWALPPGVSSRNRILDAYKRGASRRGLCWKLPDNTFDTLISQSCHYCGSAPSQEEYRSPESFRYSDTPNAKFLYNGIDRVNNKEGYTVENIVPCCSTCNKMKGTMNEEEFRIHLKKLAGLTNHYSSSTSTAATGTFPTSPVVTFATWASSTT